MANKIKFTQPKIAYIIEQVALGRSIKRILADKEIDASWEGWRKILNSKPKIRQIYETAQKDGVDFLLSSSLEQLQDTINEFKVNGKGDLAIANVQKEIIALTKWKASHLLSKFNAKTNVQLSNLNDKPLVVKWQK